MPISKSTPLSLKQWEMIKLLSETTLTRSQMIQLLGISRATFYRWLKDLRVQKILKDLEKRNLDYLSSGIQKRWSERIKKTKFPDEYLSTDLRNLAPEELNIEELPKEIRENLPQRPKKGFEDENIYLPDQLEPDWPKIREMMREYEKKQQEEKINRAKEIEDQQNQKIVEDWKNFNVEI